MLAALYQIIVYPVYAMIEIAFHCLNNFFTGSYVMTIFVISFIVNMFCLPLYLNAEKLQNEEIEVQKKLKKRVESIKKNFKGDERQMLLQTYYRQNNYHPIMSLRLSFSLLLQIPFFIAAYLFFSHLQCLSGTDFWLIKDLARPDNLIKIGHHSINVLPILMTVINIYAGNLYTKKYDGKGSLQLWIMSLVFLVLLYNSPSGLVIYWTFNNIFSLIKNIILLSKDPKKCFKYFLIATAFSAYLIMRCYSISMDILVLVLIFAALKPMIKIPNQKAGEPHPHTHTYILSCAALITIFGILIPTGVIATAPGEFLFESNSTSPLGFLSNPFFEYLGLFGFWAGVVYILASERIKKYLTFCSVAILAVSIFNMLYFKMPKAIMDVKLNFENPDIFAVPMLPAEITHYILFLELILVVLFVIFYKKKFTFLKNCLCIVIISSLSVCIANAQKIYTGCKNYNKVVKMNSDESSLFQKTIHFSRGKNVLIIFLDRAISGYLPSLFKENPQLKDEYQGFVYYPNTSSFYGFTLLGYPPLAGGYEYTPLELAKTGKNFRRSYSQAYLMMPEIFKNAGWNTTVTDSHYANFEEETPPEFFTKHGHNYLVLSKKFGLYYRNKNMIGNKTYLKIAKRNLFWYSLLTASPKYLRSNIYDHGKYFKYIFSDGVTNYLIGNYAALKYLPQITDNTSKKNSFIIINNELTHNTADLQGPDYKLSDAGDRINTKKGYGLNGAALTLVGQYLEYLKENNLYDNTRIIIVADHGYQVNEPDWSDFQNFTARYNPLLLVKDFNDRKPFRTSKEFMTNADTPYLATSGVIKAPVNPFTGRPVTNTAKNAGIYVIESNDWHIDEIKKKNSPILGGENFHKVKNNIFEEKNWIKNIPMTTVLH